MIIESTVILFLVVKSLWLVPPLLLFTFPCYKTLGWLFVLLATATGWDPETALLLLPIETATIRG